MSQDDGSPPKPPAHGVCLCEREKEFQCMKSKKLEAK